LEAFGFRGCGRLFTLSRRYCRNNADPLVLFSGHYPAIVTANALALPRLLSLWIRFPSGFTPNHDGNPHADRQSRRTPTAQNRRPSGDAPAGKGIGQIAVEFKASAAYFVVGSKKEPPNSDRLHMGLLAVCDKVS
jgi:hypothetical protein